MAEFIKEALEQIEMAIDSMIDTKTGGLKDGVHSSDFNRLSTIELSLKEMLKSQ